MDVPRNMGTPIAGWLILVLLKQMILGYHNFRKPPYIAKLGKNAAPCVLEERHVERKEDPLQGIKHDAELEPTPLTLYLFKNTR